MTYEETLEELKFAMKHGIGFTKHDVERILPKEDVERIAKELYLRVECFPVFMGSSSDTKRYYVLSFENVGDYFCKNVTDKDSIYVINTKTK